MGGGFLCETFLVDVRIPVANVIGERAGGWEVLMYTLDFERITAEKLGGAAWVLDATETRLRETGRLDAASSARLERLRGQLGAARLLSFRAADVLDRDLPGSSTSAMAKLAGARVVQAVGDATIDLLGLEGLADGSADAIVEGRAAALYRASAGSTIAGGVSDVQKLVIARRGLGTAMSLPLEGVRVVDATQYVAGPLCGSLLHELGAEVVKVEPPTGDAYRGTMPVPGGLGRFFVPLNRGKRSVTLDLKADEGRAGLAGAAPPCGRRAAQRAARAGASLRARLGGAARGCTRARDGRGHLVRVARAAGGIARLRSGGAGPLGPAHGPRLAG